MLDEISAALARIEDGSTRDVLAFLMAEQTAYPVTALGELLNTLAGLRRQLTVT